MAVPGFATSILPNFLDALGLGVHDFETGSVLAKGQKRSRSKKRSRKRLLKRLSNMMKRVKSSLALKGERGAKLKSSKSSADLSWQSDTSSTIGLIPAVSVVTSPSNAKAKVVRNPTMNRAPARFLKEAPSGVSVSTESSSLNEKATAHLPESERRGTAPSGTLRPSLSQRFFMPERRATDMDIKTRFKNALTFTKPATSNHDKHTSTDSDASFGSDDKVLLRYNSEDVSPKAAKVLGIKGQRVGTNEKVERVLGVRSANTRSLGSRTSRASSGLDDDDMAEEHEGFLPHGQQSTSTVQEPAGHIHTRSGPDAPVRVRMAPVWLPRSNTEPVISTPLSRGPQDTTPRVTTVGQRLASATSEGPNQATRKPPTLELPQVPSPLFSPPAKRVAPPLPPKNPGRGLLARRARIIDGVPFEYEHLPLPNIPAAVASKSSSVYSERSVSTSVMHDSNFHWDELTVARPDSGILPHVLGKAVGSVRDVVLRRSSDFENEDVRAGMARLEKGESENSDGLDLVRAQPEVRDATSTPPLAPISLPLAPPSPRPKPLLERIKENQANLNSVAETSLGQTMGLCHSTVRRSRAESPTFSTSTTLLLSPSSPPKRLSSEISSSGSSRGSWYGGKSLFTSQPLNNPLWIAPLDPFQVHVYLVIGEALHDHIGCGILRLRLPCAVLVEYSEDLRARIETTLSLPVHLREPIRLPITNPRAFEIYLQWLYHGNLHMHVQTPRGKHAVRRPEIEDLLGAWEVGRDLLDSTFQNACTDHIQTLAREMDTAPLLHVRMICYITTPDSGLRKLFYAMMCEEKLPLQWRRDENLAIQRLGREAYEEYKVERRENGKMWDKRKLGKEEGSWREDGCQFHEHDAEDECGVKRHLERLQIAQ